MPKNEFDEYADKFLNTWKENPGSRDDVRDFAIVTMLISIAKMLDRIATALEQIAMAQERKEHIPVQPDKKLPGIYEHGGGKSKVNFIHKNGNSEDK